VIVSAIGAPEMAERAGDMQPYFAAKAQADAALESSRLDYTIVRPGGLTDEAGAGEVTAAPKLERGGTVARDDVAGRAARRARRPEHRRARLRPCRGWNPDRGGGPRAVAGDTPAHASVQVVTQLTRRTQILLDENRHRRLRRRAESTGASIGELVREAIDLAYPEDSGSLSPAEGAAGLLDAEPMPVDDWPIMKAERNEMWEEHLYDDLEQGEAPR